MSTGTERRWRRRLVSALATLALGALFVHLGLWQWGKARQQEAARLRHEQRAQLPPVAIGGGLADPQALAGAPVVVQGRWDAAGQFFVDNRQEGGRPGLHVVTPLKIEGGETRILVNRGWIAWSRGRQPLPQVATPDGPVRIHGVAALPVARKPLLMAQDRQDDPRLWFAPDIERFRGQHAYPVQPLLVLQDEHDAVDGLVRRWPPPEDRSTMHRGYAFQWFGMAAVLLVFYLGMALRRRQDFSAAG